MQHKAVLVQSWFAAGIGILFGGLGILGHWTEGAGGPAFMIATFSYIVIAILGIITANSVRTLEERISGLERQRREASRREESIAR